MCFNRLGMGFALLAGLLLIGRVSGEDAYAVKPLGSLEIVAGQLSAYVVSNWHLNLDLRRGVSIRGPGDAVIGKRREDAIGNTDIIQIAVRIPNARDVEGMITFPDDLDAGKNQVARFRIPASEFTATREQFLRIKLTQFIRFQRQDLPGGAWFRHRAQQISKTLGIDLNGNEFARPDFVGRPDRRLEDTFELFSGGSAISENLQLDRVLPTSKPAEDSVPLSKIAGISVREFDWKPWIQGLSPGPDPIAKVLPGDQHAVFFPTFAALLQAMETADVHGTPFLQFTESRGENAKAQEFYQRQLCLPLGGAVEKFVGSRLIDSVAITGGDPYFRTGTDVAVLFESNSPMVLQQLLQARIKQAAADFPAATPLEGQMLGVRYTGLRSPDRRVCSYLCQLDNIIVVANSPGQLQRILRVQQSVEPSLAQLPEYTFFRNRYPRGAENELAFLILTDQTIRRWCGPKWRIATSRRTRAAAVLADIQARNAESIVRGKVQPTEVPSEFWLSDDERLSVTASGATSSQFGGLQFQTPIGELEFDQVTAEEARLYSRWRDRYQQNWSNFFDPIAVRFANTKQKLAVDVTVMPLIDNSEYNRYLRVSKGARIGNAGDPHPESLAHLVLAINPDSESLKPWGSLLTGMRINPLTWLGNAIALYVDQDPIWLEAAKAESSDRFIEQNYSRLPVAIRAEVRNGLLLSTFLAGLRVFIEETTPGILKWETLAYRETPYVKVSEIRPGNAGVPSHVVYYCASSESLVVSFHEGVLKRAIDRQVVRRNPQNPDGEKTASVNWLGDNLSVRLDGQFHKLLAAIYRAQYQSAMQNSAWSNIPILNEWKSEFPELDPVRVHELLWHRQLICPGGGQYRWNEEWQTMESTVYGHPGQPRTGPELPAAFLDYQSENFGVTFEEHGLRARMELQRKSD